jgi:hypothetical protein
LLTRSSFIWLSLAALIAAIISLLLPLGSASSITVEWTTASELNTAGFNLYRSESAAGDYQRLNAELVPGSTDPLTGGSYSYTDTNVIAGRTYYYQLEDIETSGATTRHEPYQVVAGTGSNISGLTIGLLGIGLLAGLIGLSDRKRAAHV